MQNAIKISASKIEAGITNFLGDWIDINVVVIEDKNGLQSIGTSQGFPIPEKYIKYNNRDIPVYKWVNICGTVIDKNSIKHTVTILTQSGIVNIKCALEQYSMYDKQISKINRETGKKEVIEKSWFKRGTKVIVSGWRSGDVFYARSRQSENKFAFYKILDIDDFGRLKITRFRAEE